jgi:demethylmenaquinone methyltransferase/2-methoxy-6-polyprenyl-1,4-benzoquinol methylase
MIDEKDLTNFGFEKIAKSLKLSKIRNLFDDVSENYDLMNDLMSFGLQRIWKTKFVKSLDIENEFKILDLACGTGDIIFQIKKIYPYNKLKIFGSDLTESMLKNAKNKSLDENLWKNLYWCVNSAENIGFADNTFDIVTIAFGIRNFTNIENALAECHRILKPKGSLYCLEFSKVQNPFFNKLYELYSFNFITLLGDKIANNKKAYEYLAQSIKTFLSPEELSKKMFEANFQDVSFNLWNNGIVALHKAKK